MWELIRANKRKSVFIFICMGASLLILGYVIGLAAAGPEGGILGISIAFLVWFILSLISYFSGDSIVLSVSRAKPVTHDLHPRLFNIAEEMKIAANLPAIPRLYIIDDPAPNAFATGKNPEKSAICVTAGLLSRLNRDELQGVVAHEMAHIMNRDVLFVTFAGILMGTIVIISQVFLRTLWYSGGSRRYRSSSGSGGGGGQAQIILIVVSIVLAILAPILARLFYFALSRKREYLADATAVRLTRYPEGLASALEKISSVSFDLASANKITAPMYIVNPLKKKGMHISNLSSTHPPISERVMILRKMMLGAAYNDYQEAFSKTRMSSAAIIPKSGLREKEAVLIRKPSAEKEPERSAKASARELGDLMRAVNKYAFLVCLCGLKIKVPPDFRKPALSCPRCRRDIAVPMAGIAAVTAAAGAALKNQAKPKDIAARPQQYTRKTKGWETFSCGCGNPMQLSPAFQGPHVSCKLCGKKIAIAKQ